MNQRKVEIKLIRHLIQNAFQDQTKTISIDDCLEGKKIDKDIESLDNILQKLKEVNYSKETILNIYTNLFPGYKNKVFKKSINEIFKSELSANEIYNQIISDNIFYDLSFVMGAIIYNIFYYKERKTFLVFFYKSSEKIKEIVLDKELSNAFFVELKEINESYHVKKNSPSLLVIKEKTLNVFNKYKELLNLERIGVFGSYGRGDYNEYSDIDILLEVGEKEDINILHILINEKFIEELGEHIDLKLNNINIEPVGFLKNCYKNIFWFN